MTSLSQHGKEGQVVGHLESENSVSLGSYLATYSGVNCANLMGFLVSIEKHEGLTGRYNPKIILVQVSVIYFKTAPAGQCFVFVFFSSTNVKMAPQSIGRVR